MKSRNAAAGTTPQGTHGEAEARAYVREMFGRIAPRYDLVNRLMSGWLDVIWRRRAARRFRHVLRKPGARVLDLCCGTGDLTLALEAEALRAQRSTEESNVKIIGGDFVHEMLMQAQEKTQKLRCAARYVEADAMNLPFADGSFDLITAAYGFRNLANYEAGLREFHRVLAPNGELGILEMAEPEGSVLSPLMRFYFTRLLPKLGGVISGNPEAYEYLPSSVSKFPAPVELTEMMLRTGFRAARYEMWTGGIMALHVGKK